jgi:imidazolonepropionase-like amidohydrolase
MIRRSLAGAPAVLGALALLSVSVHSATPPGQPAPPTATLIRGGTVLTITKGTIDGGDVLIRDGRIAAVGKKLDAPPGARIIDAAGRFVMPGIVDTHSHMGVYPWPEVDANSDGNEATDPVTPFVRAEDSVWAEDPEFERARAGGVTTVQILPGSANLIGGEALTVKLRPGVDVSRMVFAGAPRGLKMALGENPKRVYGDQKKSPSTRMGEMADFRDAFNAARNYKAKWDAWKAKKEDERGSPPDRDLKLDTLVDLLEGRILAHVHSYRKDEILMFLKIADEYGFKIASFQHCLEGYKIADELKKRDIAVATFAQWWGYKVEAWDGIPHNAALLAHKGVRVSIHSDSGNLVQRLYNEAAVAARYGLSEEDALKAITINAATALGIGDRVGSLEVGKDADIAIFTRHPLDMYTLVEKTFIDGDLVYERGPVPTPADLPAPPPLPKGPSAPEPSALVPRADTVNPSGLYAFVGARVFTMTGPPIDNGTVVVENGRIREVGPALKPPSHATVIDAKGEWIFPGLIESYTHLGLSEIDLVQVMRDDDEGTDPVAPQMRALDSFYTESELIPVARLHGITGAFTAPGEGDVFAGAGAVVHLDGATPDQALVKDGAALVVNLGEPPKERYGGRKQSPSTRMGVAAVVRDALTKARNYQAKWDAYEEKKKSGAKDSSGPPTPPDRDLKMEALLPALQGKVPVLARAHRVDDILTAVRLAEEFKLKLILSHGTEAYKVADLLASKHIPVVVGPITVQPERVETLGAIYDNAARLSRAGVVIAIQSGETLNARMLPYEAGLAVAYGLPWEQAIRAVTVNPAEIFGVADRIGSLKPGLDADLIATDGDPLQPLARLRHLMIKGRPMPLTSRQTALYEKWR